VRAITGDVNVNPGGEAPDGRLQIVCGTDLLPRSEPALERAAMMAARLGAELTVVHAVGLALPAVVRQRTRVAHRRMRMLTTPPQWQHGRPPSVLIREGSAQQVVCDTADELHAGLMVLGANRVRIAQDLLTGAIVEHALRRLDCPLLIVRRMPWWIYRRVLVLLEREDPQQVMKAAGRLVLLYLPTYSPWLNPIEMLWRHFRREVTHCQLFATVKALLAAARDFFDRYNHCPNTVLSIIGSHATKII